MKRNYRKIWEANVQYRKCVDLVATYSRTDPKQSEIRGGCVTAMWVWINELMRLGEACPPYERDIHEAEMERIHAAA